MGCVGREVGQGIGLEVPPKHLGRIDFGRVGRKEEAMEPGGSIEHSAHQLGTMGKGPVPDDKEGLLKLATQEPQEAGHARGRDVFLGMETKVKSYPLAAGRHRKSRNGGDLAMVSAYLVQKRCPAARSPGASNQRSKQKAAFVDERNIRVQPARFFLMSKTTY